MPQTPIERFLLEIDAHWPTGGPIEERQALIERRVRQDGLRGGFVQGLNAGSANGSIHVGPGRGMVSVSLEFVHEGGGRGIYHSRIVDK